MPHAFRDEVGEITSVVQAVMLPEDIRDTVQWCLKQLPARYELFCHTYESRYADEILRLEQGILEKLAACSAGCRDAPALGEAVLGRLQLLNERHRLPRLVPKTPPAPRVRSRKKAK